MVEYLKKGAVGRYPIEDVSMSVCDSIIVVSRCVVGVAVMDYFGVSPGGLVIFLLRLRAHLTLLEIAPKKVIFTAV